MKHMHPTLDMSVKKMYHVNPKMIEKIAFSARFYEKITKKDVI